MPSTRSTSQRVSIAGPEDTYLSSAALAPPSSVSRSAARRAPGSAPRAVVAAAESDAAAAGAVASASLTMSSGGEELSTRGRGAAAPPPLPVVADPCRGTQPTAGVDRKGSNDYRRSVAPGPPRTADHGRLKYKKGQRNWKFQSEA